MPSSRMNSLYALDSNHGSGVPAARRPIFFSPFIFICFVYNLFETKTKTCYNGSVYKLPAMNGDVMLIWPITLIRAKERRRKEI